MVEEPDKLPPLVGTTPEWGRYRKAKEREMLWSILLVSGFVGAVLFGLRWLGLL